MGRRRRQRGIKEGRVEQRRGVMGREERKRGVHERVWSTELGREGVLTSPPSAPPTLCPTFFPQLTHFSDPPLHLSSLLHHRPPVLFSPAPLFILLSPQSHSAVIAQRGRLRCFSSFTQRRSSDASPRLRRFCASRVTCYMFCFVCSFLQRSFLVFC